MKKIFSVFALTACMLSGVVGTSFAQDTSTSDLNKVGATGWTYARRGDYVSSTPFGSCAVTVTAMPSGSNPGFVTITGATNNTGSDTKWYVSAYFTDKNGRKFVVSQIGSNAFTSQTNATEIWLNYLTYPSTTGNDLAFTYDFEIGSSAFKGLSKLKKCGSCKNNGGTFRVDCKRIGTDAFKGCSAMTDCNFRATKNGFINSGAFSGCSSLSSNLYLSGSIDKTAFEGCTSVKAIYWYGGYTSSLTSSSQSPMYPMRKSVETINIFGSVPAHFFEDFTALKEVKSRADFFDNLANTNIYYMGVGEKGFGYCSNLTSVQVAGAIHPDAFASCPKLTSVTYRGGYLANSQVPTSENGSFFYSCRSTVTSFTIEETSTNQKPNSYIPSYLCYGMSKLTSVTIPNYVPGIGEAAFKGCKTLSQVTFAANSTCGVIGTQAFMDCAALSTINLPVSIERIYDAAFEWCESLAQCPLKPTHTKLTYLGREVFYNAGLTYLYIPENVKKVGSVLIGGSRCKVTSISFMPKDLTRSDVGGSWANLFVPIEDMYKSERKQVTEFRLNPSRVEIPDSLFYNYEGLAQVLTDGGSPSLKSVVYVGKNAFRNCKAMWGEGNQTQMANVTEVGESAFEGSNYNGACKFEQLSTIGKRAFANTQLMYMHDMGTMANLKSIGEEAFANNAKLASAEFNGVQTIGVRAFANNAKLETITISTAVPAIQSNSFEGCNVKTIKANCSIIDAIKADANWTAVCANIQATDTKYTQAYLDNLLGNNYGDSWWSNNGKIEVVSDLDCEGNVTLKCNPDEGYTFAYWRGDGSTENPRNFDLSNYDLWYLGALCYNEANLYQTNFQVKPAGAGAIKITNQYGHNRNDQKFIIMGNVDREEAYLTPMSNGWYDFKEWEYDEGSYSMRPEELYETPGTYSLMLDVMENMGAGEFDPETGMWMDGGTTYDPQFDPNLTAVFELKAVPVAIERCTDGNGTVELSEVYSSVGSTITLTATPKEGFEFDQWEDGNKDATRELTITPELLTELQPMGMDPELGEETYNEYPVDMGDGMLEAYHPESSYKLSLCAQFKKKDATGLGDVQGDKVQCTKIIRDGVLYIMYNGTMYNVQGLRVK